MKKVITQLQLQGLGQFQTGMRSAQRTTEQFQRNMTGIGATKMTGATAGVDNLNNSTGALGATAGMTGHQWEEMGRTISNAGRNIATVTGAITALGVASVVTTTKISSSFEDAFADLRKVTNATEEEFEGINRSIRDLTKEIPATYEEITEAASAASRLGVETDNLVDFAETAVMMGTATDMASETAAESLARFSNVVGTSLDDVEKLGSTVVELGNNYATTESEIMAMSQRLAGSASQVGMTEGDILGLSAAMRSVGVTAEMGGTAMSKTINQMSMDLAQGGDDAERWASRAGMSVGGFKKAFEEDALGALISVMQGLEDATEAGENMDLMLRELGITEMRQLDVMRRTTAGLDDLIEAQEMGNKAFEDGTALTTEAEQRYETFSSQMAILTNRIRDLASTIGGLFADELLNIAEKITPLIEDFSEWVDHLVETDHWLVRVVPKVVLFGTALMGLLTAISLVGVATGFLMTGFGSLKKAILPIVTVLKSVLNVKLIVGKIGAVVAKVLAGLKVAFVALTGPIGLTVAAIASVIGALVYLYNTNEEVRDFITGAWESIKSVVTNVAEQVFGFVTGIAEKFTNFWEDNGETISEAWANVWGFVMFVYENSIKPVFELIQRNLGVFKSIWDVVWNGVVMVFKNIWGVITTVFSFAIEFMLKSVEFFAKIFAGDFEGAWETVKESFRLFVDFITDFLKNMFVDPFLRVIEWFSNDVSELLASLWDFVKDMFFTKLTQIGNLASSIWEWIKEIFSKAGSFIWESITNSFSGMVTSIKNAMLTVLSKITGIWSIVMDFFRGIDLVEIGKNIIQGLMNGITGMAKGLLDSVTGVVSGAVDGVLGFLGIKSPSRLMMDVGGDTAKGLQLGIEDGSDDVLASFDGIMDGINADGFQMIDDSAYFGDEIGNSFSELGSNVNDYVSSGFGDANKEAFKQTKAMADATADTFTSLNQTIESVMKNIVTTISGGYKQATKETQRGLTTMTDFGRNTSRQYESIGANMMQGLRRGIVNNTQSAVNSIVSATNRMTNAAKSNLRIHSPSRVFAELGGYVSEGLAGGIDKDSVQAVKMVEALASALTNAFDPTLESPQQSLSKQVRRINRQATAEISSSVQSEVQVGKEPAYINVRIGKTEFRRFVEDITDTQEITTDRNRRKPRQA